MRVKLDHVVSVASSVMLLSEDIIQVDLYALLLQLLRQRFLVRFAPEIRAGTLRGFFCTCLRDTLGSLFETFISRFLNVGQFLLEELHHGVLLLVQSLIQIVLLSLCKPRMLNELVEFGSLGRLFVKHETNESETDVRSQV